MPNNYELSDRLTRSYRSFSGVDIKAVFGTTEIGQLQGISYTVTREKAPNYVMSRADPISFSRGKRGIAGSMIFLVYDRTNLLYDMEQNEFWADKFDIKNPDFNAGQALTTNPDNGQPVDPRAARAAVDADRYKARAWYHDQLPPFDIVLTAMNEYGLVCKMAIHGVEILNAGSGMSIDDITTDENMTFVATDITPWAPVALGADTLNIDIGTLGRSTT